MKRSFLPALIMLTAGAIDCVLSFMQRLTPLAFTKRLLLVLVIFYVLGTVILWIVNENFPLMTDEEEAESETGEEEQEEEAPQEEAEPEPAGEEREEIENINAENSSE